MIRVREFMRPTIQVSRAAACLAVRQRHRWPVRRRCSVGRSITDTGRVSDARETPTVLAIRRASPAVVNIHGQKTVRSTAAGMAGATGPDSFRQVNGMGTGVVIDPRGYVITNYHVVEDVDDIRVTLHNGETTSAELVASRIRNDWP